MMAIALGMFLYAADGATPVPDQMRWVIMDAATGRSFVVPDEAQRLTVGGRLHAEPEGSQLVLSVEYSVAEKATQIKVKLADRSGEDRGLVIRLELGLPGAAEEWVWWQDLDTSLPLTGRKLSNTAALRGLPGLPEFAEGGEKPDFGKYSVYPLGVVSWRGSWIALARRMNELVVGRFMASGAESPTLSAEVDMALSEFTIPPREAEFSLWFFSGEGEQGLRAGLDRCYALWPEDWEVRVPIFGGWMPFTDLAKIPNVDEFGFAYQEGAPNAGFDDALGALSFVYFHCAGEFANVEGYKRGTEPLPPYEKVVEAFNAVAEKRTGIKGVWDICGIRGADGKIAYRPEKTYGDFFCQACVDPDLPYGRAMIDTLLARVNAKPFPQDVDGVYYDGIAAGLDYAPEHLKAANHLLLWDSREKKPVNYNLFSSVEWARQIHNTLAGTRKLTMLNDSSLSSFTFASPYIDVPGAEMSIYLRREQARLIRAYTCGKPFCTLVKADFSQHTSSQIETYMRRCLAYGILFGFFDISPSGDHPGSSYWVHPEWYDRDRPLFRRYMPLARELAGAGWRPLPGARATADAAYVERFGPGNNGLTYLTVSTDPGEHPEAEREVVVEIGRELVAEISKPSSGPAQQAKPAEPAPAQPLAVELLTGRIETAGERLTVTLRGDDMAVWAIGERQAQAQACLDRARDILALRKRYIQACRLSAETLSPWGSYGEGGGKIVSPGRESSCCLEATLDTPGTMAGATQSIPLNHDRPRPLIISAWSKAENVTGNEDRDYALYADCYYADGTALYGQTVSFAPGTHDWQYGEHVIQPEKPIARVNVYLLFRGNHTGRVWFDDIRVALADDPEKNLLQRPGFEPFAARPLADDQVAGPVNAAFDSLQQALEVPAIKCDYQAAYRLIDTVERAAREANWGADTERTLRDVEDLRWHLRLAQACLSGKPQMPQRDSRVTPHVALMAAGPPTAPIGVRQYEARTGKVPPGTTMTVDSLYTDYSAQPLTDGQINPAGVHWTKVAWASAESDDAHWIELTLPKPMPVKEVRIWWALDSGKLWMSRKLVLQVKQGNEWVAVEGQELCPDAQRGLTTIRIGGQPLKSLQSLRIFQPPHGGAPDRPGIMWVSEVEIE
jgi:hypothetical protein